MNLDELKKIREQRFLAHKRKKRAYYLKRKQKKEVRKSIDYENELNDLNFATKIKEIAKAQKKHVDDRKELIVLKINEYKEKKKEYYEENKRRRLEYDKKYREEKKERLRKYRREYYQKNREKILAKQRERRISKKEE